MFDIIKMTEKGLNIEQRLAGVVFPVAFCCADKMCLWLLEKLVHIGPAFVVGAQTLLQDVTCIFFYTNIQIHLDILPLKEEIICSSVQGIAAVAVTSIPLCQWCSAKGSSL